MFFGLFKKTFSIYAATSTWLRDQELSHLAMPTVASTNDLAKNEAGPLKETLKIYLTDHQTAGRGRGPHSWSNPASGDSLMCSWSYALQDSAKAITAPLVGLALYRALQSAFKTDELSIKAPNDIYLGKRKLLGLLVESVTDGQSTRLIIGFGFNVFSHPKDVPTATHLSAEVKVSAAKWREFLELLRWELEDASRACQASHLTESQRDELLRALNANPLLAEAYVSVSPFGDLSTAHDTMSWRDL